MAIYNYECPNCGYKCERLVKNTDAIVFCDMCDVEDDGPDGYISTKPQMRQVLSVPSPMQWGCRKGF